MCGRYYVDDGIWNEIRKICHGIDEAKLNIRLGDVRPTDFALVLSGGKEIYDEKVDMKEGCERRSFLFATVEWQDNNVIYSVY